MPRALRLLGFAGAALLLLGPAIAGAGALNWASTLNASAHCTSGCDSGRTAVVASEEGLVLDGVGLAVGGAGLGLVLLAALPMMARASPPPRSSGPP